MKLQKRINQCIENGGTRLDLSCMELELTELPDTLPETLQVLIC
jgi:hypothetical protein